MGTDLLQVLVHKSDGHTTLADCGRNAFDRAQAHIAASENAGDTRLEQKGITVVRPPPRLHHVVTGQHVATTIARDFGWQPPCVGIGSNEYE
jgi:hypothetical protein